MGISRAGEFEVYRADIRQPRTAAVMVYHDTFCWMTLGDSSGAETTIFVNLDDEGDRAFVAQLRQAVGVLAIMAADEGEVGGGDDEAADRRVTGRMEQCRDM